MNKKVIISCILLTIIVLGILFFYKDKRVANTVTNNTKFEHSAIYDKDGKLIQDTSKINEIEEIIENTTICGTVELSYDGRIYIFNGQHFGEYGLEMEEYTRANIKDTKQECIDYYTAEKYDTSYIQEGDIIICTGDLTKYKYYMRDSDFDTKDNSIIVLKSKDYNNMKKEALNNEKQVATTIEDYYDITGEIYIKYNISDKEYNLPFALKFNIAEDTQIIGNLARGKKVKVQYKEANVPLDKLEIKTIEVIEE